MAAARVITTAERRARLGTAHRLAVPASGALDAADAMVALHATDPATIVLSVLARAPSADVADVEKALYVDRSVVRMLSMRRTVWVTPRERAPVLQAACSRDVAARQRRLLVQHLTRSDVHPDPGAWLEALEERTVAALNARGEATAAELVAEVPELRTPISLPPDVVQHATSRVLNLLSADGHILRGRPLGSWTSTQYRWSPTGSVWPGGMPELDPAAAYAQLARDWLRTFGPAPASDLQWWAGWPITRTRAALAAAGAVAVDLDGEPGFDLPDAETAGQPRPWVALLPALDPTPMGWQRRDWYLGEHKAPLFDRTGNIGPTVWSDGRIVGGWAQTPTGTLAVRLLEDIGAEATAAVHAEAERLAAKIGPVRVVPRFRTPLERELAR
ncbi:winged helix DNA-binding domain-containing protein [Pseudonocardia sp. TRM90224]|uniref:winged helix DNA-binding domain-containing protein n=1 Tax=Pseudonocardia sp. TRM90224 TaxID=2812678 RepID=UPI001E5751AD|nr:winged helix DNA-binding domain-containing protein [Pseudonocardia sp. TRM90224]